MIAEELALYLQARGHATKDVDLFLNFQPDEPDDCAVVYDETAPTPAESHALSVDQFGVQIIVRNNTGTTARDNLRSMHQDLAGFGGQAFVQDGEMIHALFVETAPASMGVDDKGRSEWTAHYRLRVESVGDLFRS